MTSNPESGKGEEILNKSNVDFIDFALLKNKSLGTKNNFKTEIDVRISALRGLHEDLNISQSQQEKEALQREIEQQKKLVLAALEQAKGELLSEEALVKKVTASEYGPQIDDLANQIRVIDKSDQSKEQKQAAIAPLEAQLRSVLASAAATVVPEAQADKRDLVVQLVYAEKIDPSLRRRIESIDYIKDGVKHDRYDYVAEQVADTFDEESKSSNTTAILEKYAKKHPEEEWLKNNLIQSQKRDLQAKTELAQITRTYSGTLTVSPGSVAEATLTRLQTDQNFQHILEVTTPRINGNIIEVPLDKRTLIKIGADGVPRINTIVIDSFTADDLDDAYAQSTLERTNANSVLEQNTLLTKALLRDIAGINLDDEVHMTPEDNLVLEAMVKLLPLQGNASMAVRQLENLGIAKNGSLIDHRVKRLGQFLKATTNLEPKAVKQLSYSAIQGYMAQVIAAENTGAIRPELVAQTSDQARLAELEDIFDSKNV